MFGGALEEGSGVGCTYESVLERVNTGINCIGFSVYSGDIVANCVG